MKLRKKFHFLCQKTVYDHFGVSFYERLFDKKKFFEKINSVIKFLTKSIHRPRVLQSQQKLKILIFSNCPF